MADFNVHLMSGLVTGAAIAATGAVTGNLHPIDAGAVFIVGTTGGLLPDIDSDTGKPLALLFQLLSVLIPVLVYPHVKPYSTGTPFLLCYFTLFYLFINYLVCQIIKKLTKHRGIMHSIPFAVLAGEAAFLLLHPSGTNVAMFGCIAVFSGCMVHLILDELHSLSLKFGFVLVVNKSSGSAFKLTGSTTGITLFTYLLVITFGIVILYTSNPPFRLVFQEYLQVFFKTPA